MSVRGSCVLSYTYFWEWEHHRFEPDLPMPKLFAWNVLSLPSYTESMGQRLVRFDVGRSTTFDGKMPPLRRAEVIFSVTMLAISAFWFAKLVGLIVPTKPIMLAISLLTFAATGYYAMSWMHLRRNQRRAGGLCPTCGYNLTANVSGVCPECGEALP